MIKRISLDLIYGNPDQPRKIFDAGKMQELAASIRENGLKQPITVRADGNGKWMIVMGERRFRACQSLGLKDILCQVSTADDAQLAVDAIIENDIRADVTPLEQAHAYRRMIDEFGFTPDTLAKKLGKDVFRIEERLRLLNLTDECQTLLAGEQITSLQAWYLSTLSPAGQMRLIKAINAGLCPSTAALKAAAGRIKDEESQAEMFAPPVPPSRDEVRIAKGFDAKVEQLAAMLRAGIEDNTITAVRKVMPEKAASMADLFAAMQKDLARLEAAFRAEAVSLLAA